MNSTKKFLLIDANQYKKMANDSTNRLQSIESREISKLDLAMRKILEDNNLTEEEKVHQYNTVLTEFQNLRQSQSHQYKRTNVEKQEEKFDPYIGIPEKFKNKAKFLMKFLQENQVTVNSKGEPKLDSETLQDVNITDLIQRAVNPFVKQEPIGWNKFFTFLHKKNVPLTLLSNRLATTIRDPKQQPDDQTTSTTKDIHMNQNTVKTPSTTKNTYTRARKSLALKNWQAHDASHK